MDLAKSTKKTITSSCFLAHLSNASKWTRPSCSSAAKSLKKSLTSFETASLSSRNRLKVSRSINVKISSEAALYKSTDAVAPSFWILSISFLIFLCMPEGTLICWSAPSTTYSLYSFFAREVRSSSSSICWYSRTAVQKVRFSPENSFSICSSKALTPTSVLSRVPRLRLAVTWIMCSTSSLERLPVFETSNMWKAAFTWSSTLSHAPVSIAIAMTNSSAVTSPVPVLSKTPHSVPKSASSTSGSNLRRPSFVIRLLSAAPIVDRSVMRFSFVSSSSPSWMRS
mmetsp:Transcript_33444/g.88081  ORF Transcript_33444/g.88081 Transcript_33444/m.88081 type:complete len:283 (-) Transcript_33444:254-1102(-)